MSRQIREFQPGIIISGRSLTAQDFTCPEAVSQGLRPGLSSVVPHGLACPAASDMWAKMSPASAKC